MNDHRTTSLEDRIVEAEHAVLEGDRLRAEALRAVVAGGARLQSIAAMTTVGVVAAIGLGIAGASYLRRGTQNRPVRSVASRDRRGAGSGALLATVLVPVIRPLLTHLMTNMGRRALATRFRARHAPQRTSRPGVPDA